MHGVPPLNSGLEFPAGAAEQPSELSRRGFVSASLGPLGTSKEQAFAVLPVLLWIILLFAASAGLPRSFVQEEETHTATALRLSAKPSALFAGKLAYGLTLLLALETLADGGAPVEIHI